MATKFNALDQFLLEDPETTPVSEYQDREDYLDATQRQAMRDISERGQGQSFIPPSLARERRVMPASMRPTGLASPMPSLTSPLEDEAGNLPPSMQTVPDLRAPDLRSAPAAQQIKESAFGDLKLAQPAVQPVPTVQTPVQKTEGTPSAAVAKMTEGAGGDESDVGRMLSAANWIRAMESTGSAISGKNLRSGIADALGEQARQVEALRLKRMEKTEGIEQEKANNRAQVDYLMSRFPERAESLRKLYDVAGKPNFPQLVRVEEQLALDAAKTKQTQAKTEDIGQAAEVRNEMLDLRRDTLAAMKQWRDVQAGFRQAELALRQAEADRKASGSAEPSVQEQTAFRNAVKSANNTAVALKDAAGLDKISGGMLSTGKPPPWLSRADIALFSAGDFGRSQLAESNPKAFDLLTEMARLKTMVGHEYFGSALSPSEAERQRQFLDFGMFDSPESVAKKMRTYHKTLGDKASVWIKPLVRGPLGQEWLTETGLDQISGPDGSFKGLFNAPATKTVAPPSNSDVERVVMLDPNGVKRAVRADQVEKAKGQGWRMP